jgi:hypothetical protein
MYMRKCVLAEKEEGEMGVKEKGKNIEEEEEEEE